MQRGRETERRRARVAGFLGGEHVAVLGQVLTGTPAMEVPVVPKQPMTQMLLPLFAFGWKETAGGWPHTRPWLTTLASILATGYDSARTDPVLFAASGASMASGGAIAASSLRLKKGLTRLTCCGWLLMHCVKVEGELPDDVKALFQSMLTIGATFSPSKGASQDTYENIMVTNRAACRQRTTSLKLCTMFANNIELKDKEDPAARKQLSPVQKVEKEVDNYNNYEGVAGVVDHQLNRDEKEVVSNVYCWTSPGVRERLSRHLNMFYEKDCGYSREMLRSKDWTIGFEASLGEGLEAVQKYFRVTDESQLMHVQLHCKDFEERAAKMKAGRKPTLPSKEQWAKQAMQCAMFQPALQDWHGS